MPHLSFIHWNEYQQKKQCLEQELAFLSSEEDLKHQKAPDGALDAFDDFISLTEKNYPLLLLVGEPLALQQKPSAIYLLPKIEGMDNRILVVQIPKKPGTDACLELYEWWASQLIDQSTQQRKPAEIKPWQSNGDSNNRFSIPLEDIDFDLNERPLKINAISLTQAMLVFELEYPEGKLIVAAPPKKESATASWTPLKSDRDIVKVERTSEDDRPEIIHYRRHLSNENWQDDELYAPDGNALNINIANIGRINGVDGSVKDGICFIATDDGRIIRVNLSTDPIQTKTAQMPNRSIETGKLSGHIEDVAMLPKRNNIFRALAPCYNGRVYLIEDNGNTVKVVAEQRAEQLHVLQVISDTNGEIIAMDQYHNLCPLRLNDYQEFKNIKISAICLLSKTPLLPESDQRVQIYRQILMRAWIWHLNKEENPFGKSLFSSMEKLKKQLAVHTTKPQERQIAAKNYYSLFKILHQWADNPFNEPIRDPQTRHKILSRVFSWLQLPEEAPDWLWLKLFNESNYIDYVIHDSPKEKIIANENKYKKSQQLLRQRIYQKRLQLAQQAQRLRPIIDIASIKLPAEARHIRRLGYSRKGSHRFVCASYANGLYAFELVQQPNDVYFKQLTHSDGECFGKGQIHSIATEIKTDNLDEDNLLLIATQRGECRLLKLTDDNFRLISSTNIPMQCATSRFITYKDRRGFLIAGSATDEKASIMWLELQSNNQLGVARKLYHAKTKGHIRMLACRSDNPEDLWCIDERRGLLLHFSLELLIDPKNKSLTEHVFYRSNENLHALYLTQDIKPAQIVCAGNDGVVTALNAEKTTLGQLIWNVGQGAAVKRLRQINTLNGPVFVTAGDAQHVLFYDQYGRLTSMLENIGPVSAISTLQEAWQDDILIMGAKSGRLIAFSLKHLNQSNKPTNASLTNDSIAYSLRQPQENWTLEQINTLLRFDESLLFQQGLKALCDYTEQHDFTRKELETLEATTRQRNKSQTGLPDIYAHRTALAIRCPNDIANGSIHWNITTQAKLHTLYQWVETHWDATDDCHQADTLYQIIESLLFIAEQHIDNSDFKKLVQEISNCIWDDEHTNEKCAQKLYVANRLRLMRLAQAMRTWRQVTVFEQHADNEAVIHWVNRLAELWGGDAKTWQKRFDWLMKSQHPFAAQANIIQNHWFAWLAQPDDNEAIRNLGFEALQDWTCASVWNARNKYQLSKLFVGTSQSEENQTTSPWSSWINELSKCMAAAVKSRQTQPHYAWLEEEALDRLFDHITAVADQQFTAENELALAALMWVNLRKTWIGNINHRLEELYGLEINDEQHYMDIKEEYHWRNDHSVQVTLQIRFRGTRGLLINYARQAKDKHIIQTAERAFNIAANDDDHPYAFDLTASSPGEIDTNIELVCQDFRGIAFERAVSLKDQRGLLGFRVEFSWQKQAETLMRWLEKEQPFYWLRGPDWSQQEHERLISTVQDRYPRGYRKILFIKDLSEALQQDISLFIAGFAPEINNTDTSLHALLHQSHKGGLNPIALSIWLWAKSSSSKRNTFSSVSQSIWQALTDQIPDGPTTAKFLTHLFPSETREILRENILAYLSANVISWSCGGILQNQEHRPWLGDLGVEAWQSLLASDLVTHQIADWFGVTKTDIEHVKQQIDILTKTENRQFVPQQLAHALFSDAHLDDAKGIPVVIHPIDVMHRAWNNLYIVPKGTPIDYATEKQPLGLWLLLEHNTQYKLPGKVLALSQNQIFTLLTTGSEENSRQCLNRIAGTRLSLNPHDVFQDAGSLRADIIERSFHGRQKELDNLSSSAKRGSAILLVGGRRIGKTALLDKLRFDLQKSESPQLWVKITGVGIPEDKDDEKETAFLRWFLNEIRSQLKEQGQVIRYDWKDVANAKQRDEALTAFKKRLAKISRSQCIPILLLDETSPLLRADIEGGYRIGELLRQWHAEHLISIIATAYPHGSKQHPSLYRHIELSLTDNPWYNLFNQGVLKLKPWTPHETWRFLAPRLAGFGLILPNQFAQSLLDFTRGVPWIAQRIGIALCDRSNRRSNQITKGDWDHAVQQTRQDVQNQFKDTVRSIADNLDVEFGTEENPIYLGYGRLWNALNKQVGRVKLASVSIDAEHWPDAHELDLVRMQRNLGEHISIDQLQTTLVALSEAGLLEGQEGNNRFIFWNDLLPAFVRER